MTGRNEEEEKKGNRNWTSHEIQFISSLLLVGKREKCDGVL